MRLPSNGMSANCFMRSSLSIRLAAASQVALSGHSTQAKTTVSSLLAATARFLSEVEEPSVVAVGA